MNTFNLIKVKLILIALLFSTSLYSQVGVNTTTPQGALDVNSTTTGFLPPRVSLTATNVAAPVINPQGGAIVAGTIVWNTVTAGTSPNDVVPGLYYWNGTRWISFAGSPGGLDWSLTGNSGTSVGTNFLGTTDNNALRIGANGTDHFEFSTNGKLFAISGGLQTAPAYSFSQNIDMGMYRIGANQVGFSTVGTRRMSINGNGRVFINTTGSADSQFAVLLTGTGATRRAIYGESTGAASGIFGRNTGTGNGVYGFNFGGTGNGVYGQTDTAGGTGVFGASSSTGYAIHGQNTGSGTGVYGETNNNASYGVYGYNSSTTGAPVGVYGLTDVAAGYGVLGTNSAFDSNLVDANYQYGVYSNGDMGATGTKTFRIDHPLDPENKYLMHYSIESNEVLNVYRGVIVFDENGNGIVELPNYYESINKDASYQLTPIGAAMPNLFIAQEIENGVFVISGGISGKKVSWQVTANRNDAYMKRKDTININEIEKTGNDKGKYLMPELFNQPKEKGIFYREKKSN